MVPGSIGTLTPSQPCLVSCLLCYAIPTGELASGTAPCMTSAEGPYLLGKPGGKIQESPFQFQSFFRKQCGFIPALMGAWRGLWVGKAEHEVSPSEHISQEAAFQQLEGTHCQDCCQDHSERNQVKALWKPEAPKGGSQGGTSPEDTGPAHRLVTVRHVRT